MWQDVTLLIKKKKVASIYTNNFAVTKLNYLQLQCKFYMVFCLVADFHVSILTCLVCVWYKFVGLKSRKFVSKQQPD